MENVVSVLFKVDSEAYKALTELKAAPVNDAFTISQAALVKKSNGRITTVDGLDTGVETGNDTLAGGIVGGLVGVLGGPLGILIGGGMGAATGSIIDAHDTAAGVTIVEKVSEQLVDGETAIIALVHEDIPLSYDGAFRAYDTVIVRQDAAEVAEEVRRAEEIQKELEKEARKRLREEKKNERKEKIEEHKAKIKADFEALKNKMSN